MKESISLRETPEREQLTIQQHQMMGWVLKSSQEINSSSTSVSGTQGNVTSSVHKENYVKLVFERDTDLPNYAMLQSKYAEWTTLREQFLKKLSADLTALSKKQNLITFLVPAIIATIVFIVVFILLIFDPIFAILISIFASGSCFVLICAILNIILGSKAKKRNSILLQPQLVQLEKEMDTVAREAEKYL